MNNCKVKTHKTTAGSRNTTFPVPRSLAYSLLSQSFLSSKSNRHPNLSYNDFLAFLYSFTLSLCIPKQQTEFCLFVYELSTKCVLLLLLNILSVKFIPAIASGSSSHLSFLCWADKLVSRLGLLGTMFL